jgi:hypothetical protein
MSPFILEESFVQSRTKEQKEGRREKQKTKRKKKK